MAELSVIITTSAHAEMPLDCLESLCRQTAPVADFEVIVVIIDSNGTTAEVPTTFTASYQLRFVHERTRCHAAAHNSGMAAAVGRYCLFLADDTIAEPGLIAGHLRAQREREGAVLLGHLNLILRDQADEFARYRMLSWNDHYSKLREGTATPTFMDCRASNMSVPRAAFLEAGGFTVGLISREDIDLGYRLAAQGLSIAYLPDACARQGFRKSFREIVLDAEREGVASVELYRRHPPMLPHLELGQFNNSSLRAVLLRRFLLAIAFPFGLLAVVRMLLGKRSWARAWYQFLYSYCYWRGVQRATPKSDFWRRLARSPVILMYHATGNPGEQPGCYIVTRRRFALHMAWLKWRGYHVLGLEEFVRDRRAYRLAPARSVIITFDDGYTDNQSVAYPILRWYGFPATIFMVSGAVGCANQWDGTGELAGRPLLSWSQIADMSRGGMQFGAHTRNHAPLTAVSVEAQQDEIAGSHAEMERALGHPILTFAYPYGNFDATSAVLVEQAGFLGACCSHSGANEPAVPLYALRRIEVRGTDSFVDFTLALWLGMRMPASRLMSQLRRGM